MSELAPGRADLDRELDRLVDRTTHAASDIRRLSEASGELQAKKLLAKLERDHLTLAPDEREGVQGALAAALSPPATRFAIAAAVVEVAEAVHEDRARVLTVSGFPMPAFDPNVALALPFTVGRGGVLPLKWTHTEFFDQVAASVSEQLEGMRA